MPVPDFQTVMRPLLSLLDDGRERPVAELRSALAREFNLSAADLEEELPSGRAKTFANRVGWATTYLYRCRLLDRPRRSVYRITDRGREVLTNHPDRVDLSVLSQFEEFHEFRRPRNDPLGATVTDTAQVGAGPDDATPEERIAAAYEELRSAVAGELLDRVLEQAPDFFERLVLDVLSAIGYGGSLDNAAVRLGRTGDEGVDGVIREDRLGLDLIYVQAKRWQNTVGRPDIQRFVGALQGQRATKGVFITTSTFSADAIAYAEGVSPRVVLVDGRQLAGLMIDYGVAVTVDTRYELKKIDQDYFAAEDEAVT
jgi:restriction system protein